MTYYSNCCSAGNKNYSVSTPVVRYSLGSSGASYSTAVSQPAAYQGSGNYSVAIDEKPVSGIEYNSGRAIVPVKQGELIMPSQEAESRFAKPIDQIIEDFLPRKHSNPAIDEIERALGNIIKMEQFEIEEEIIIRRKLVKKSAIFQNGRDANRSIHKR